MSTAQASVIIPCSGRTGLLADCLESLCAQEHAPLEILIVDNSPRGMDPETVPGTHPVPRRILRQTTAGVDHARNLGVSEAKGSLLVFTDDDVVAPPGWLRALTAPFADPAVCCVGGPTRPLWDFAPEPRQTRPRTLSMLGIIDFGPERRPIRPATEFLVGANMACRRDCVSGTRGFRRIFPFAHVGGCSSDYELSRRLCTAGRVLYEPAAFVHHRIWPGKAGKAHLLRRAFCYSAAAARLGAGFSPKRGLGELCGWEGLLSLSAAAGHLVGRLLPSMNHASA
jgi:GT2 family glycosyltransferase